MALTPLPQWFCCGCGRALQTDATDQFCHRCLDRAREALAQELASPWGMSYGRSLPAVFAKPRGGPGQSWHRRHVEADDEEEDADERIYGKSKGT
jgi:hypothetical protein